MRIIRALLARLRGAPPDLDDPVLAEQARRQAEAATRLEGPPVRMDDSDPPR
jgi:hypothetical protein